MKTSTKNPTKKFGTFKSVSAFLDSYRLDEKQSLLHSVTALASITDAAKHLSGRLNNRAIAHVEAKIVEYKGKSPMTKTMGHYLMLVTLTKLISRDPRVASDIDDAFEQKRRILVVTRYGDTMGIMEPSDELAVGLDLKLQGEWITAEQSVLHGGANMSVLHFTHHPIGFICTPLKCYA